MLILFPGDSFPDGCAGVTSWLVELKVTFPMFSYFLFKCEAFFFFKGFDDFFSSKQMG